MGGKLWQTNCYCDINGGTVEVGERREKLIEFVQGQKQRRLAEKSVSGSQ